MEVGAKRMSAFITNHSMEVTGSGENIVSAIFCQFSVADYYYN